jgi:hypothetical protein
VSDTLLFSLGVSLFAIVVVASMLYGFFLFNRAYNAEEPTRST